MNNPIVICRTRAEEAEMEREPEIDWITPCDFCDEVWCHLFCGTEDGTEYAHACTRCRCQGLPGSKAETN